MIRYCCPVWAYVRNFLASAILLWSLWQKSPRKYGETKWESRAVIKCESEGSFKRAPPSNSIPGDYASSRVLLQVCYIFIDNAIVDNMRTKKAYVHILSPTWVSKKIRIPGTCSRVFEHSYKNQFYGKRESSQDTATTFLESDMFKRHSDTKTS